MPILRTTLGTVRTPSLIRSSSARLVFLCVLVAGASLVFAANLWAVEPDPECTGPKRRTKADWAKRRELLDQQRQALLLVYYLLFERMCAKTVRSGEVNEFNGLIVDFEQADMPLNGDARIIAYALAKSGQTIEECALARVRAANHRDAGICLPASGDIFEKYAGFSCVSHRCRDVSR